MKQSGWISFVSRSAVGRPHIIWERVICLYYNNTCSAMDLGFHFTFIYFILYSNGFRILLNIHSFCTHCNGFRILLNVVCFVLVLQWTLFVTRLFVLYCNVFRIMLNNYLICTTMNFGFFKHIFVAYSMDFGFRLCSFVLYCNGFRILLNVSIICTAVGCGFYFTFICFLCKFTPS